MKPIIVAFLHLRRAARLNDAVINAIYDDMTAVRRRAKKLELASPFNAARAALLRADADGMESGHQRAIEIQREIGVVLIGGAWEFDEATTLTERCELLNVNVADRGDLTDDSGLMHIANAHGLEDSAQRRREDWKSGPLFSAINAEMMRIMFFTDEGRAAMSKLWSTATAPGGLFEGLPLYDKAPDGTMVKRPPTLVIHDAAGSRVIPGKSK